MLCVKRSAMYVDASHVFFGLDPYFGTKLDAHDYLVGIPPRTLQFGEFLEVGLYSVEKARAY